MCYQKRIKNKLLSLFEENDYRLTYDKNMINVFL